MADLRFVAQPSEAVHILCVEPARGECQILETMLRGTVPEVWRVWGSPSIASAESIVRTREVPVVFCDSHPSSGTWQELLRVLNELPEPPLLVVTSRLADERLWAEVLNLGAHDVLAKPYEQTEVSWVVSAGLRCWHRRRERMPVQAVRAHGMRAAS